jgi:hypothetical protein
MFLGEGFSPATITPKEWVSLFFFPFGLILGAILGWWKEGLGGVIMVVSVFAGILVSDPSSSGGGYMLICASPGFLFLLSWILSKSAAMSGEIDAEEKLAGPATSLQHSEEVLEERRIRLAASLCPKCGHPISYSDKNCPSCHINLMFAAAHFDGW